MKQVRLACNIVVETIPPEACIPSITDWYGKEFADQCIAAPDDVKDGWVYDPIAGTFSDPTTKNNNENRIRELKDLLFSTDYIAIKYAEGWITAEEYEPTKTKRQAWRDEINTLEAENAV